LPQLENALAMQSRGAGAEFSARVPPEIVGRRVAEINLRKSKRLPFARRLRFVVDSVNENRHPLLTRPVGIDRTTGLARRLDLDALCACLGSVVWIDAFHEQIGMTVEMLILRQRA
jgi:hypothetical protein